MNLLDTINANYKINKQPLESKGLQDSNYWDGLWIREYVEEYLQDGTLNPEYKDFRSLPFEERGYHFLGHGNALSFNLTAENTEIVVDSTKEKMYMKGNSGLEITVEMVNKFSKLLAKLGVSGMILKKPQSVSKLLLGSVETEESILAFSHVIKSNLEVSTLLTLGGVKFAYGSEEVELTRVLSPELLTDETFFIDQKTNSFLVRLSEETQNTGTLSISYTGDVEEVIVGYGGESKENKLFNIVQIYNDKQSGKVSYREAFKCVIDPSRNMSFRGQNATDGGSTQSLKFNASEDVTRPAGEQLFIEKDDWDMSLSG
jgi:hypothetical protein